MTKWYVLYEKEMLEMVRSAKWIWVPLVFLLLGIMQPVTTYFTPTILKSMGGLPEGTVIDIPLPTGADVLIKTLSQYGMLGILILVLSSMGTIAAERTSGVAAMVLMKPVKHGYYVTAKWAAVLTLTLVSFFLGYLGGWYYTGQLIETVSFIRFLESFAVYGLWLVFVVTVMILAGAVLKSNGAIAFLSLLVATGLSVAGGLLDKWMQWSPSRLTAHAGSFLKNGGSLQGFGLCLTVSLIAIAALLTASVYAFKQKDLLE